MPKRRLTILADEITDKDIVDYFNGRPVTETGLKLIRAGIVMDRCDVIDQLNLLVKKGLIEDIGPVETLIKAIEMMKMISKPAQVASSAPQETKPPAPNNEPVKRKSVFGAKK